jgi:hypothetical protein
LIKKIRDRMLDPEHGLTFEARAVLRTKLGLPAETPAPSAQGTNAPSETPLSKQGTNTSSVRASTP